MFFFFQDQPENVVNYDFDFFLYDNTKIIHLATAGMQLMQPLLGQIEFCESNLRRVLSYRRNYKYEINPNIERDNLSTLEDYTYFFALMAKRGFYSYDKVEISDPEDFQFQLIAKPSINKKIILKRKIELGLLDSKQFHIYDINPIETKENFPESYDSFDIRDYL